MNQTFNAIGVHTRWLIVRDLPEVLAIEAASNAEPWTEKDIREAMNSRNCIGMVAERGEQVMGFMVYELCKRSIHIMNMAVHPRYRRCRIGSQMFARLAGKLSAHQRRRITANVCEDSLQAQLFFRAQGAICTRIDRGLFAGLDGYRMVYEPELPDSL